MISKASVILLCKCIYDTSELCKHLTFLSELFHHPKKKLIVLVLGSGA